MGGICKTTLALVAVLCGMGMHGAAVAADADGHYAVRGAGLVTCELYQRERQARSPAYLVTAAWVDGYITATNQRMADTYDVAPFESTELLAEVIAVHCADHPRNRLFPVVHSLLQKLYQDRLRQRSEKQAVTAGERRVDLYTHTVQRVQQALAREGLYHGAANGRFDAHTREAIQSFQRTVDFEPTGFPDQATLWRLLRQDARSAAAVD